MHNLLTPFRNPHKTTSSLSVFSWLSKHSAHQDKKILKNATVNLVGDLMIGPLKSILNLVGDFEIGPLKSTLNLVGDLEIGPLK